MLRVLEAIEAPKATAIDPSTLGWGTHSPAPAPSDAHAIALTIKMLFDRYDGRGYLRRLYVLRIPFDEFRGGDRPRARSARAHFVRALCSRGLLLNPPKDEKCHARICPCEKTPRPAPRPAWCEKNILTP
jgi:hypothetical protein